MRNRRTADMVTAAIFIAIIILLAFTPGLGYIPLGAIRITTVHIPVIIGAILLGPKYGAILGGVFGTTSFINNTFSPVITSFVFTPFYTIGEAKGNLWSIVICFVPRILIGVVAYYVYVLIRKIQERRSHKRTKNVETDKSNKFGKNKTYVALMAAGVAGSLTNTILVMNLIYFCFGRQYAAATSVASVEVLYTVIMGIIAGNGVPEAIVAAIITAAVGSVLLKMRRNQ